jgi:glycine cleavage system regulatory protein
MSELPTPDTRRIVLTLLGPDRPGIVARVASLIAEHGGNWMESRMVRLGGHFAGLVQAQVPAHAHEDLLAAIERLRGENLRLAIEPGQAESSAPGRTLELELVTPDRPGILRSLTGILARHGCNVEELATEFVAAPWSGELLFKAVLTVSAPPAHEIEALREALEDTAPGMMLDLSLNVG